MPTCAAKLSANIKCTAAWKHTPIDASGLAGRPAHLLLADVQLLRGRTQLLVQVALHGSKLGRALGQGRVDAAQQAMIAICCASGTAAGQAAADAAWMAGARAQMHWPAAQQQHGACRLLACSEAGWKVSLAASWPWPWIRLGSRE